MAHLGAITRQKTTAPIGRAYHCHDGAIAQLEERPVCIREVAGSIPAGSIPYESGAGLEFPGVTLVAVARVA